jgi:histone H3/H4
MVIPGSERLTKDLDSAIREGDLAVSIRVLYESGFYVVSAKRKAGKDTHYDFFETEVQARYAVGLHSRRAFKSVHIETGAELDIWIRPDVPYEELLKDAGAEDYAGVAVRVASAAHMIRLKQIAIAENPERKTVDGADIEFLRKLMDQPARPEK